MSENQDDDSVGYKRPPEATRFKKGRSGNPSGRRKGTRNILSDLVDELSGQTEFDENGRHLKVSKQVAVIKTLVAAALDGDLRAIQALLTVCARIPAASDQNEELSPDDQEILDAYETRKHRSD